MVLLPDHAKEGGYFGLPRGSEGKFDVSCYSGDYAISELHLFASGRLKNDNLFSR